MSPLVFSIIGHEFNFFEAGSSFRMSFAGFLIRVFSRISFRLNFNQLQFPLWFLNRIILSLLIFRYLCLIEIYWKKQAILHMI